VTGLAIRADAVLMYVFMAGIAVGRRV